MAKSRSSFDAVVAPIAFDGFFFALPRFNWSAPPGMCLVRSVLPKNPPDQPPSHFSCAIRATLVPIRRDNRLRELFDVRVKPISNFTFRDRMRSRSPPRYPKAPSLEERKLKWPSFDLSGKRSIQAKQSWQRRRHLDDLGSRSWRLVSTLRSRRRRPFLLHRTSCERTTGTVQTPT